MDGERFDAMTRRLATGETSRRRLFRTMGGLLATAALVGRGGQAALAGDTNTRGKKTGDPGAPSPQMCDNCDGICSNCPVACCLSLAKPRPEPDRRPH